MGQGPIETILMIGIVVTVSIGLTIDPLDGDCMVNYLKKKKVDATICSVAIKSGNESPQTNLHTLLFSLGIM